jgi:hypothetical protein
MRRSSSPSQNAPLKQSSFHRSPEQVAFQRSVIGLYLSVVAAFGIIIILFFSGRLVVAGVPSSIILRFLEDEEARRAYFSGDVELVQERIVQLNVTRQLKEFYRPHFSDEAKLDLHVHQILYDRTRYVGDGYEVNARGRLAPKKPSLRR